MSGFESLEQAIPSVALDPLIKAEDTAFEGETLADDVALGLVLADAQEAISYLQSKGLVPLGIDTADDLIRAHSKQRAWSDGKLRANLPMFVVMEAIEKLMPVFYMALFGSGKRMPFVVTPMGKTTPEAARAKAAVLYWAVKQANLKEEMRLTLKTALSYGWCCGIWGWENKTIREKEYTKNPDGSITGKWKEVQVSVPTYQNQHLKNILVDPHCNRQDVQKGAGYIIKQVMLTANDLKEMRSDPTYKNIPSDDELREILSRKDEPTTDSLGSNKSTTWREFQAKLETDSTSKDPLQQPLEYLERWDNGHVIGALQRKITIRNEINEFHKIPAVSAAMVDVLNSCYGFGVARLLAGEQRLQGGVANNWIDSLALILNPVYQLLKGIGPGAQNIAVSPGKVITESGELKPLITPDVTGPAMEAISTSEQRAAKRVGAEGGSNMPTQALRTGTGVNALEGAATQRLQYLLEIFINLVYLPVLEEFLTLCYDHLQPVDLNRILTAEQGKAWEGDILDLYTAQVDVDVLAGANLLAKVASAQLAPMIIQLVSSEAVQDSFTVQNKKFDFESYIAQTLDIQGLDIDSLILEMSPADQQRAQQQNAAMAKGAADAKLQAQKHADDMDLANEKGTVSAGVGIIRDSVKGHIDSAQSALEALNEGGGGIGQPGSNGGGGGQ